MVLAGTVLQNRYLIEKQIGEGGMGAVYLAIDQKFDSRVAIKETLYQNDDLDEAFEREARLLNSLHHPILPHVSDVFIENGGQFLVMEYIQGEDFSEMLKRDGAFPVEDVVRWTNELLDALDFLHSQEPPIIHRDIKPGNLKLTSRGNIVLLDFGLAKVNSNDTLGMKSVFGYSRKYSPLEQIQGTGTDARSDIFALGATIFHLLTGKPPVDVLMRASAVIAGKPDPLELANEINSQVPVKVAQVIQAAMALNPDSRFVSANAMRKALEHALVPDTILDEELLIAPAAVEHTGQALNTVEDESFPALESFAMDAAQDAPEIRASNEAIAEVEIPIVKSNAPTPEFAQQTATINDGATKVRRTKNKPVLAIAATLLLVLGGIAAVWLGFNQTASSSETNQAPIAESTPAASVETEQTANVSASPAPEESPVRITENVAQTKVKSDGQKTSEAREKPVEEPARTETVERSETREKPAQTENQPAAARRPATVQNQRRRSTPPVANEPTATTIENIMTGVPSEREQRREARRRYRQMSEQEREELRRRRTQDILRRNRQPLPPN